MGEKSGREKEEEKGVEGRVKGEEKRELRGEEKRKKSITEE